METKKILAAYALGDVVKYVKDNWSLLQFMVDPSVLSLIERATLNFKNILSFSQPVTGLGLDFAHNCHKVEKAAALLKSIGLAPCLNDREDKIDDFKASAMLFAGQIQTSADELSLLGRNNSHEPKSLNLALSNALDVFDDFISGTKNNNCLKTLEIMYTIEHGCRSKKPDNTFKNDYSQQRFAYAIRLFATLVQFVLERRKEITVAHSSDYPGMANAMDIVVGEIKEQIRLLEKPAENLLPVDKINDLKFKAKSMESILRSNNFMALALEYEQFSQLIEKKSLAGDLSSSIILVPAEIVKLDLADISSPTLVTADDIVVAADKVMPTVGKKETSPRPAKLTF